MNGSVAIGIEKIMNDKGYAPGSVAEKAGFNERAFRDMLKGQKIIRVNHIVAIAKALNVPVQAIYDAGRGYGVGADNEK